MEFILNPWPWYISGFLIAVLMALLILVGKKFGMSTNLETTCTILGFGKVIEYFNVGWKNQRWSLIVVIGAIIGGFIASNYLTPNDAVAINDEVVKELHAMGFKSAGASYLPTELFDSSVFSDFKGLTVLLVGGLLVGFGARYAGGCTSGHAISGLSNLQLPSLIAVIGFFIGGLIMIHFIYPLIF